LKPEQWGSPLVQEKYQEEKACDKRHPYRIIIIITILTIYNKYKNVSKFNAASIFAVYYINMEDFGNFESNITGIGRKVRIFMWLRSLKNSIHPY